MTIALFRGSLLRLDKNQATLPFNDFHHFAISVMAAFFMVVGISLCTVPGNDVLGESVTADETIMVSYSPRNSNATYFAKSIENAPYTFDTVDNQYIVLLDRKAAHLQGIDRDEYTEIMTEEVKQKGAKIIRTFHSFDGYVMKIPNYLKSSILGELRNDPRVSHIELDRRVYALNHMQTLPTGVDRIDGDLSYTRAGDGVGSVQVDVAILDTGIDLTHPDLNVYRSATFVSGTTSATDDNGHGTLVAGIVGAKDNHVGVVGVTPDARLWAVKVLDKTGSGFISDIIAGIDYIIGHSNEIDAANLSFGCRCTSAALDSAINSAAEAGIIFAAAAGNQNSNVNSYSPANNPNVMAVSAIVDTDGKCGANGPSTSFGNDDTLASFSNYGSVIDMAAPGVGILSTSMNDGYAKISGTSASAPHVAGAAALYVAQNAAATPDEVRSAILKNSILPLAICDGKGSGYFTGDRDSTREPLLLVRSNDNQQPFADSKTVKTKENIPINIVLSGRDPENGPLTFEVVDVPKQGKISTISGSHNKITYTPNMGFIGLDTLTYIAKDDQEAVSPEATVSIAITVSNPALYHKWQATPSSSNDWSVWEDIGGGGRGDPVVVQNSDGRLEVFAVSLVDNQLYHQWQTKAGDSQSWTGWRHLGSAITIRGEPVAAKNSDGRLEIFAANAVNNQLYHKWQIKAGDSNSWSVWQNIGSAITIGGDPVISTNPDGRLEIFAVSAANNQLYHKWQTKAGDSNSWSVWQNIGSLITIRGEPVIEKNSDGRLEVFAVAPET